MSGCPKDVEGEEVRMVASILKDQKANVELVRSSETVLGEQQQKEKCWNLAKNEKNAQSWGPLFGNFPVT